MMAFVKVSSLDELWVGDMRPVTVNGRRLVVIHVDGAVCAYEDRCSHLGVPLSRGHLDGDVLTCSAHHYQYDARTGDGINPCRVKLTAFPVQIAGDDVLVDVDADVEDGADARADTDTGTGASAATYTARPDEERQP